LIFQSEANVEKHGGIQAIESEMSERASWFFRLGTLWFPTWVEEPSKGNIPYRRVKPLLDAWFESGSPRKPGKLGQKPKVASKAN
jgi:isoleucyl-tRNA synthetase